MIDKSYIGVTSKNTTATGDPPDLTYYSISGNQIGNITQIGFAAEDDYQHLYACGTDNYQNAALFRATGPTELLAINFSKVISTSGSGALAHLPYRDENDAQNLNFYCSMGDKLYISNDGASNWSSYLNT